MRLPILCYHQVGPAAELGRRLNIEPEVLCSHIRFFIRRSRRFIQCHELVKWPRHAVCLTFDDAYASTAKFIVQSELPWTASVYAVPARVGSVSTWDADQAKPLASWDDLRAVERIGFEVGNHTMHHSALGQLNLQEQVEEWQLAHVRLTKEGLRCNSCCVPYGSHNDQTAVAIERAGYRVGLALGRRPARVNDDRRLLPRIVVSYDDKLPKLIYKIWLRPCLPTLRHRQNYVR